MDKELHCCYTLQMKKKISPKTIISLGIVSYALAFIFHNGTIASGFLSLLGLVLIIVGIIGWVRTKKKSNTVSDK